MCYSYIYVFILFLIVYVICMCATCVYSSIETILDIEIVLCVF